ncbi:MAG: DNA adenine methylase [Candidatus Hodarchaeales archaeon]
MSTTTTTTFFADFNFPKTRYQGSKRRLLQWFYPQFRKISFETVLDGFGGTGSVSYLFKKMAKQVTYNDVLLSNYYIGLALIENKNVKLDMTNIDELFEKKNDFDYLNIISKNFQDIYFTDSENHELDIIVQNILRIDNSYKRSLCLYALFQACIMKRPFNLFHRKNLSLRMKKVKRSFGNKKTWDTPIKDLFTRAIKQANNAVYDNKRNNKAYNSDILDIEIPDEGFDLVYLDPPYISKKNIGVDYRSFYHFLEGICRYYDWESLIDNKSKHKRLFPLTNDWTNSKRISRAFESVIKKFQDSKLVISYRSPGVPTIDFIYDILSSYKESVRISKTPYKYALTSKGNKVEEILLIAI